MVVFEFAAAGGAPVKAPFAGVSVAAAGLVWAAVAAVVAAGAAAGVVCMPEWHFAAAGVLVLLFAYAVVASYPSAELAAPAAEAICHPLPDLHAECRSVD